MFQWSSRGNTVTGTDENRTVREEEVCECGCVPPSHRTSFPVHPELRSTGNDEDGD